MPTESKLTAAAVARCTCPPGAARLELRDSEIKGLQVYITAAGRKTWYLVRRISGRLKRWRLGEFPVMGPPDARKAAAAILGSTGSDIDAPGPPLIAVVELAAATLWAGRPDTIRRQRQTLERYSRDWLPLSVDGVDVQSFRRRYSAVREKHGLHAANRWRTILVTLFDLAVSDFNWRRPNPAKAVRPTREAPRERRMNADEVARLLAALKDAPQRDADLVQVALFTGARRSNVFRLQPSKIDLNAGTWTIPPDEAKARIEIVLPLDPRVVDLLGRRCAGLADDGWVFAGKLRGKPITDFTKPWAAILTRAEIPTSGPGQLKFHDLRRSLASFMADTGASDNAIGRALGHSVATVTQIYARPDETTVRDAVTAAIDLMLAAKPAKKLRNAKPAKKLRKRRAS